MRLTTALAWAGALFAASSANAREYVNTVDAGLRVRPGWESPAYGVVPACAPFYIDRCAGAWCRVRVSGYPGYLPSALIASATLPFEFGCRFDHFGEERGFSGAYR